MTYYLPKRYAAVTYTRTRADSKAAEALDKAKATEQIAKQAVQVAKKAVEAAEATLKALPAAGIEPISQTHQGAQLELVKRRQEAAAAEVALKAAETARKTAEDNLEAFKEAQGLCGFVDAIRVELLPPVADTSRRYMLDLKTSPFRRDQITLATTSGGLLKTVEGDLDDQSAEILVSLAKSVATRPMWRVTTPRERYLPVTAAETDPPPPTCKDHAWQPVSFRTVLDPADEAAWRTVSNGIRDAATVQPSAARGRPRVFAYKLEITDTGVAPRACKAPSASPTGVAPLIEAPPASPTGAAHTCEAPPATTGRVKGTNGIYYRRELPLLVKVSLNGNAINGFVLVVPNGTHADRIEVPATAFANNKIKLGFDNGVLVKLESDRPSPVLSVVSLPWTIAKETIGILAEIIQFRVNYAKGDLDVLINQRTLIQEMATLIEAQRALEETRSGGGTDTPDGDD